MPRAFRVIFWMGVLAAATTGAGCGTVSVRSESVATELSPHLERAPTHVQFLRDLVQSVPPGATSYRHTRPEVRLDSNGKSVCHADCSSLLNEVFQQTLSLDEPAIRAWLGRDRPRAREYFETISSEHGFRRITLVTEIKIGDVIAIRYESGAANTGHVMVVNAPPRVSERSLPIVSGARAWEVDVIDSSASGHGPGDSRTTADGGFRRGLGRGTIRLFCGESGEVLGHTFTMSSAAPFRPVAQRPIVVGRLTSPPVRSPR